MRLRGLARNVLWAGVDVVAGAATQLLVVGLAARQLGRGPYGVFALTVAVVAVASSLQFVFGLTIVGAAAREVAGTGRGRERADIQACHALCSAVAAVVVAASAVGAVVVLLLDVAPAVGARQVAGTVVLVAMASALAFLTATAAGVARGATDYRLVTAASVAGKVVTIGLVVALLRPAGLVALGLAQLGGQAVTSAVVLTGVRRTVPWFSLRLHGVTRADLGRVAAAGVPLLALSVGGQVVAATDLVVISSVAGAAATGAYQLGATLPNRAAQALFQGYDVSFPYLAATAKRTTQETATRLLTRAFSLGGALGFGLLVWYRERLGVALAGAATHSALSDTVLVVTCGIWLVITVIHGVALLVISRGRPGVLGAVMVVEAVVNGAMTVAAVLIAGAAGAALATLVTVAISNLVVLPLLLRREVAVLGGRFVLLDWLLPVAIGLALACAAGAAVDLVAGGLTAVGGALALGGGLAVLAGAVVLGPQVRALRLEAQPPL